MSIQARCYHQIVQAHQSGFRIIRVEKSSGRNTEIVAKVPRFGPDDNKERLGDIRFKALDGKVPVRKMYPNMMIGFGKVAGIVAH
jgi:hypothetical protein